MKRLPNPWFLVPAVIAAVIGAIVGWRVAYVSCSVSPDQVDTGARGCVAQEIAYASIGALVAFVGVGVVLVLAFRSLAEWRDSTARGSAPPGPGCEAGDAVEESGEPPGSA